MDVNRQTPSTEEKVDALLLPTDSRGHFIAVYNVNLPMRMFLHGRQFGRRTGARKKSVGTRFCQRRSNVSIYRQLSPVSSCQEAISYLDRFVLRPRQRARHAEHIPAFSARHVCAIRPRCCGQCRGGPQKLVERGHRLGLSRNNFSHCQRANACVANSSSGCKISQQHSWTETPHHLCPSLKQSGFCQTEMKFYCT